MRKFSAIAAVVIVCLLSVQPAAGRDLRVMTYNIHHSEGRDGVFDIERIAGIINAASPDLVSLQELDQGNLRSGLTMFQLNRLAELTGMQGYFGPTMNYLFGQYGNGVLVSPDLTIVSTNNIPLPNPAGAEPRRVIEMELSFGGPGVDFVFYATHLDHTSNDTRVAQAQYINSLVIGSDVPALLAGDLNARPSTSAYQEIVKQWLDTTNMFNSGILRSRQLDYVMHRQPGQWQVVQRGQFIVNPTTFVASDHYPYLTVMRHLSLPGDANRDGRVDGEDFLIWQAAFGMQGGARWDDGDFNHDGRVDGEDFLIWQSHFGTAAGTSAITPEPAGVVGLLVVAALAGRRVGSGRPPSHGC